MSLQIRPTDRGYQEYLSNHPATDRGYQEYLSNHPAVLLSKDRGIERTGKRDAERSISGVYTRAERN
jgi:hypothetical protein